MTALEIAQVRPVIESEIDRLIAILDMLEPDPDFEEGADLEEDTADAEPSLASTNKINQLHWSQGETDDTEEQCDDEGVIDCDLEPDHDNERWSDGFPNPGTHCGPVMTTMAQSD